MTLRASERHPLQLALLWWLLLALGGAAMLLRLLPALGATLPPADDFMVATHRAVLGRGLTRLLLAQLLAPPPYLIVAGVFLGLTAGPIVRLAGGSARATWSVVAVGVLPFLGQRLGQVLTVWALPVTALGTPGAVMQAAHRFSTGPLPILSATVGLPSPAWQQVLMHVTLVDAAVISLWAAGLRRLDGAPRLRAWHVGFAAGAVAAGAAVTAAFTPIVLPLVLGR